MEAEQYIAMLQDKHFLDLKKVQFTRDYTG